MTQEGETITMFGDSGPEKLTYPASCIPNKNMFSVADTGNNCIKVFNQAGNFLYKFGNKEIKMVKGDWKQFPVLFKILSLMGHYNHSILVDTNIIVSTNCTTIGNKLLLVLWYNRLP